jgi:hypothetical protein
MPLDIKMDMLSRLANRSLYNWQLFYNPANDQSVIVTIVESINADDADRFLDLMISTGGKYVTTSIHPFQIPLGWLKQQPFRVRKKQSP